jgi:hypothetical protein
MDLFASMQLDGNPLDEVPLTSTDRPPHPRRGKDIAIISAAVLLEFLIIPRTIVPNRFANFQWLALKVRSIELAYLGFQITQTLIANFKVKLNQGVDMTFVRFESRNPFQVDPDALEFDDSGGHVGV